MSYSVQLVTARFTSIGRDTIPTVRSEERLVSDTDFKLILPRIVITSTQVKRSEGGVGTQHDITF